MSELLAQAGSEGYGGGDDDVARPRKIETAKDMERAIKRYFKSCEGKPLLDEYKRPVIHKGIPVVVGEHPPTVTGLARALGLGSRQSLLNYQGREEFADLIADAKARVMEYAEERLYDRDGARGAEFTLRFNFGWGAGEDRDKQAGGVVVLSSVEEDVGAGGGGACQWQAVPHDRAGRRDSPSPTVAEESDGGRMISAPTEGEEENAERGADKGTGERSGTAGQENIGSGAGAGDPAERGGGDPGGEP